MFFQVVRKFYKDPIKTLHALFRKISNMAFCGTQGHVTPKENVRSSRNSYVLETECLF